MYWGASRPMKKESTETGDVLLQPLLLGRERTQMRRRMQRQIVRAGGVRIGHGSFEPCTGQTCSLVPLVLSLLLLPLQKWALDPDRQDGGGHQHRLRTTIVGRPRGGLARWMKTKMDRPWQVKGKEGQRMWRQEETRRYHFHWNHWTWTCRRD